MFVSVVKLVCCFWFMLWDVISNMLGFGVMVSVRYVLENSVSVEKLIMVVFFVGVV